MSQDPTKPDHDELDFVALGKLTRDLKTAARLIGRAEARFLVDFYYTIQRDRIRTDAQFTAHQEGQEPNQFLEWLGKNFHTFENNIKSALNVFSLEYAAGRWASSITGIGPVISAGLLSTFDVEKSRTYGAFWRFAGLDITVVWPSQADAEVWIDGNSTDGAIDRDLIKLACDHFGRTAETLVKFMTPDEEEEPVMTKKSLAAALARRPWNGSLKTLMWKAGESFIKVQNNKNDFYGHVFARRKEREVEFNREGKFADQATLKLATVNIGKGTDAYQWYAGCLNRAAITKYFETPPEQRTAGLAKRLAGPAGTGIPMLPPDHINSRARRYAVKLFIAHLWHVMYVDFYGVEPRVPYPFEKLKHDIVHLVPPPNFPWTGGGKSLREMKR